MKLFMTWSLPSHPVPLQPISTSEGRNKDSPSAQKPRTPAAFQRKRVEGSVSAKGSWLPEASWLLRVGRKWLLCPKLGWRLEGRVGCVLFLRPVAVLAPWWTRSRGAGPGI